MMPVAGCVGRDTEIDDLHARYENATAPELIVVRGDRGIGKSTLLACLVETTRAHPDLGRTRWARASPWERNRPGALLRQLLQIDIDWDADEYARRLVNELVHQRTLIAVDDADEADHESLQTVVSVLRTHRDVRALVVCTMTRRGPLLPGLRGDEIRLAGLAPTAVDDLAAARGIVVHPAVIDQLTTHTGGNPRDVLDLLDEVPARAWARADVTLPAPARIVDDVRTRLRAAAAPARSLIEALAILDDDESLATAATLAAVDDDPLTALDAACATGLVVSPAALTPADAQPHLASPLVRAAVLEVMGMESVGAAHRRAADVVADPARRLHHRVAATPTADPSLADDLDSLARERGADGAWAEAASLFRQSGRLTAEPLLRDTRTTLAVDALLAAGDCVGAGALVPAVESLRETPMRNATLAYLAILRGRPSEARVRLDRAWSIVNFDRDPDTAAMIAQRYVLHNLVRQQGTELVEWADRAIEMAGSTSTAGIESAVIRGLGLAWSGRPADAVAEYESLTERIRFGAQAQRATMGRGWLQLGLDDVGAARSNLETAVSMAQLGGSTRITLWAMGWLARTQFLTGDWEQALRIVVQGRTLARSSGIELATPLLNWTAAQIHSLRGEWDEAERSVAGSTSGDYEMMRIPDILARAQIAEAAADYAKVIRTVDPLVRMAADVPALTEPGWWPWVDVLANALVIEGRLDAADDLLNRFERRTVERGHRSATARLKYARGRYLGAIGEINAARGTFEEALALLDGLPLRYDVARVNFAYGQTLRRAGKRRAADAIISTARDIYLSLGATTYVERCDRELKAGGLNIARGERDSVDLTPQEESVTALVARGLSNREVAAELFISPKTVQYHLTRIYAKLGVRSRSELAANQRG